MLLSYTLMKAVQKHQLGLLRIEPHIWHSMWAQTMHRLDVLRKRVNECKDIQHASEFARWLRMSGLVTAFEDNPQNSPLVVDGAQMRRACEDLLQLCADQWKRGAVGVIEVSELELLNRKLDLLANRIAGNESVATPAELQKPSLRVLPFVQDVQIGSKG